MSSAKFSTKSVIALLALAGLASITLAADETKVERLDIAEGKLFYTPPADWKRVEPRSRIVQYEFRAPKDAKEDEAACRVTIVAASGGVEANIDRWVDQFEGTNKEDVKVEKKEIAGQVVHLVEITGTFKESMGGGPFAPGPMKKFPDYRLLGGIIVTRESGTIFVKMTGPTDLVKKMEEGFRASLDALESK